jgi:hypothetical protein
VSAFTLYGRWQLIVLTDIAAQTASVLSVLLTVPYDLGFASFE